MKWHEAAFQRIVLFGKQNKLFVLLLVLAAALFLYFFAAAHEQGVWYDEADYLNYGRFLADGKPEWGYSPVRPPLFPLVIAGFFWLGLGEQALRLFIALFYLLNIFIFYLLAKSLFGKDVGLVSAFLLAVYWSHLFFSLRLLVDTPVLTFWLLSIYLFVQGYIEKKGIWYAVLLFPVVFLGFLVKYTNALVVFILIAGLLLTEGLTFLRQRTFWLSVAITSIMTIPFFIWQYVAYGHPLAFFITAILEKGGVEISAFWPSVLANVKFLFPLAGTIILIAFCIGLLFFLDVFLGIDLLLRRKGERILLVKKAVLLLWLAAILIFAGKLGVGAYIDERYYFNLHAGIFLIVAYGAIALYQRMKHYNILPAIALVSLVLIGAGYENFQQAHALIVERTDAFQVVKEAGAWLQKNMADDEHFWSQGVSAELQYYAHRRNHGPGLTVDAIVNDTKLKYYVLTGFNQMSDEFAALPSKNPALFKPVQAFTLDGKQPLVLIFEVQH